LVDQGLAHLLDAHAHAGEFCFPLARSAGVVSTVATTWAPWMGGLE
jgi:hypothetical protein